MSQMMSQVARQVMRQEQRLTPQLIQAMDILQLNAMALEARIAEELDGNPALEAAGEEADEATGEAGAVTATEPADGPVAERPAEQAGENAADFERLDNLVSQYDWFEDDEYQGTRSRARLAEESDNKLDALANTAARPGSLREFLLEQWSLVELDERSRRLGELIIDALDDAGRLGVPLDELVGQADPPATLEELEEALRRVQALEPAGIAARDLRECLLLQLAGRPGDNELPRLMIERHFEDLQKNRLPQIAKALDVELEDVKEALTTIGRLSLHPGVDVVDHATPVVMPDVLVEYDEDLDRYTVRLARSNQRDLRISPEFRAALEATRGDKSAREFIKGKIDAANAIIDALRFRRERLLEVARAVVDAQRDFLDRGEQHLRVLLMSDLAERFGCDPSTISRTVDGKWMQTPRGIFPLRRFFTGGTESSDGEALGWESIRAKVKEIIEVEDKSNPLSDDEIVHVLATQGIELKRRTVAKYRAQLNVPTARQRKQY